MNVIFLGIGGSGMRGLAYLLAQRGETIIGYDDNPTATTCSLDDAVSALRGADRLVYTDAALENHPLRIEARTMGVRCVAYQKALGEFSSGYTTIAITGTHGKSSTTAFLSHILIENGVDPTVLIGAHMPTLAGEHAQKGASKYFIVEADEYRRHFLELAPAHIIITSIDFDHPDAFSSLEDTRLAYSEFIARLQPGGHVIVPEQEQQSNPSVAWPTATTIVTEDATKNISVPLPGKHMQMNAALACEAARLLGVSPEKARGALQTFPGLFRRFELLGIYKGVEIRSDYGHHPTEIAATITGARTAQPDSHIIAIFEAHMPLRLHTFLNDFVQSLSNADSVLVVPPFVPAGRDSEKATEDAIRLTQEITNGGIMARYVEDTDALFDAIAQEQKNASRPILAIGFSAGTLDSQLRKIVKKG